MLSDALYECSTLCNLTLSFKCLIGFWESDSFIESDSVSMKVRYFFLNFLHTFYRRNTPLKTLTCDLLSHSGTYRFTRSSTCSTYNIKFFTTTTDQIVAYQHYLNNAEAMPFLTRTRYSRTEIQDQIDRFNDEQRKLNCRHGTRTRTATKRLIEEVV